MQDERSTEERRAFAPGTRLGPYEIVRFLAAGGMSEIYLARDTRLGRDVAVKALPAAFGSDRERVRRFEHEVLATSRLNHPNIVSIYDVGEAGSIPYFVTELLEGKTLKQELESGSRPIGETLARAVQILRGLAAAHAKGIIHRDLKPANIVIGPDGHVKILDFGLAKLVHPERETRSEDTASLLSEPGRVMGSIGYMAPEQVEGKDIDHRTDIFSFGVILYEMLAGRRAFHGSSPIETLHSILNDHPPSLTKVDGRIPPALDRVVARCTAKMPEERFQSVNDLLFALREAGLQAKATRWLPGLLLRPRVAILTLIAVALAAAAAWTLPRNPNRASTSILPPLQLVKLTDSGNIYGATLSPDKKFLAYGVKIGTRIETRLKHLGSGSEIVLVPGREAFEHHMLRFTPDGDHLFFCEHTTSGPRLRRIPILGGDPVTLSEAPLEVLMSCFRFSLSPDGQRIAFVQPSRESDAVIIASADGSGRKPLVPRLRNDEGLVGPLTWSPDGRTLATSYHLRSATGPGQQELMTIDATSGTVSRRKLRATKLLAVFGWLPDASGLAGLADAGFVSVRVPEGTVHPIASAGDNLRGPQLIDPSTVVALTYDEYINLWTLDTTTGALNRITMSANKHEGQGGLAWTADGRIVFTARISARGERVRAALWICNADGSGRRQLTRPTEETTHWNLKVSPVAPMVVYTEINLKNQTSRLMQIHLDGTNSSHIEGGDGGSGPSFTPDGRSIVFIRRKEGKPQAWRVPMEGGEPTLIADDCAANDVDPSGKWLLCCTSKAEEYVIPLAGGTPTWRRDVPANYRMSWTPDGKYLSYAEPPPRNNFLGNIWLQPVSDAPAKRLTNFTTSAIWNFAWSPDGKRLVMSREIAQRDAVLLTNVPFSTKRPRS